MNRAIYENNMNALEKKYPVWAEMLRAKKRKQKNFDVIVEQSYSDESIMKICDHGRNYYLNGKYAPSAAAEEWLAQQGSIDKFASVIIIGISNGVHIKKIMESVSRSVNILIYEPSYEIFRRAMEEFDLSFLFQLDIPVGIIVENINEFEIKAFFRYFINYDNLISLKIYMSGNYRELFPEQVGKFVKDLKRYLYDIEVSWNTVIRYTDVNAKNTFYNLPYLYEGYSLSDLKGILPEDVPAIIVSAGPSLNKNISDLKEAVGKACIIATDTAMKPLLNAGIVPDLFMIVDGLKPAELFDHKDISKTGMVTMTAVSTEPMKIHKGKKYFYYSGSPYELELIRMLDALNKRGICLPDLPTGGSVANSAYSLGVYMGAKIIILIGQDLALTGNKVHVDGAFENESCDIDLSTGEFLEVKAVDGGKVITRSDFKLYLDWFEMIIRDWNIRTIDATEGGALISGTKVMTLKKAIKKYCVKKYNTKWHIARIPKIFETLEEKEYAIKYFKESRNKMEAVEKKAKEGLKYYENLRKLLKKNASEIQIQKIYKKIKKINTFMEKDEMAETVIDSLKGIEYTLRPSIYHTQDNMKDELSEIADQGELMLTAILRGAGEIKSLLEESILPYAQQQERCLKKEKELSDDKSDRKFR